MLLQKPETSQSKLFLLAVFGITFLLLYSLLSNNNRLATDDYFYLKNVNDYGVWNGMIASYSFWVTRWSAILFLNVALKSYNLFHSLLPYHFVTLIVLVGVLLNLIRVVANRFLQAKISFITLLLYTILLIASFFFFSFSISETFFWVASTAMYLWSIIFSIAGVTFILQLGNKTMNITGCALCFLFVGGAAESIAIHQFMMLSAGIIYIFYKNKFALKTFLKKDVNKRMLISFAMLFIALLISFSGEGRMLRQSALPDTGILKTILVSIISLGKLILFQLPLKIHWLIFFSVPWIYLGSHFSSAEKESLQTIFKKLTVFFLVFLLLSFISFIPSSLLLGTTGPFRTWIPVSFYLAILSMTSGLYLGYKAAWKQNLLSRMFSVSLLTLIVLMLINILIQKDIITSYAFGVDRRIKNLLEIKSNQEKNTVVLDALPPSGMLYSAEISEDSSHFSNQHLKDFLELEFEIKKRPK